MEFVPGAKVEDNSDNYSPTTTNVASSWRIFPQGIKLPANVNKEEKNPFK